MSHIVEAIEEDLGIKKIPVHVSSSDVRTRDEVAAWGSWQTYPITTATVGGAASRILPQSKRRRRAVILVAQLDLQTVLDADGSTAAGPVAGTVVASISSTHLAQGTYQVNGRVYLDGTVTAADEDNFKLVANGLTVSNLLCPAVVDEETEFGPFFITFPGPPTNISVQVLNNASAAAVYHASLFAVPVGGDAMGSVTIGSRGQVMNGQGGTLMAGQQITVENEQELWVVGDGISVGAITVLDERYSEDQNEGPQS